MLATVGCIGCSDSRYCLKLSTGRQCAPEVEFIPGICKTLVDALYCSTYTYVHARTHTKYTTIDIVPYVFVEPFSVDK